ncbi:MAG: (Fe-S)-binding protein [Gammaproteobacteria bacterium]
MTDAPLQTALFVTCLVDFYRPTVGMASIKLLEQAGASVAVPTKQTCCGQPAFNNGDLDNARAIARQVIEAFEGFDYVVAPSGSCGGMIKCHYPELFEGDPVWGPKAQDLSNRVYELTQFLHDVAGLKLDAEFDGTICYHDSCSSLREMNVQAQPRALMDQVKGLERRDLAEPEVCCGFGGTFCIKYPEISTRLASDKAADIQNSGADTVLAADMGCLLNIAGRLSRLGIPIKAYHVAEVLAGMADKPIIPLESTDKPGAPS